MEDDALSLRERWSRYLEEHERFWRICLEVARFKPHLSAEAVETEAALILFGLKPKPRE